MSYWWVNQGQTYREEHTGGYLWSPKRRRNGAADSSYDRMPRIAPGDYILHYAGGYVRSASVAVTPGYSAQQPAELRTTDMWDDDGWRVDVRHATRTIELGRPDAYALGPNEPPFNIRGGVKQAYLFEVTSEFGAKLVATVAPSLVGAASGTATRGHSSELATSMTDLGLAISTVALESGRQLEFAHRQSEVERTVSRSEWRLVDRFIADHRIDGQRRRYELADGSSLFSDLWLPDSRVLVEAKASSGRQAIREAIGQLADYATKEVEPVRKMLLVPDRPADDLLLVLRAESIVACWLEGDHWVRSDEKVTVWSSA